MSSGRSDMSAPGQGNALAQRSDDDTGARGRAGCRGHALAALELHHFSRPRQLNLEIGAAVAGQQREALLAMLELEAASALAVAVENLERTTDVTELAAQQAQPR